MILVRIILSALLAGKTAAFCSTTMSMNPLQVKPEHVRKVAQLRSHPKFQDLNKHFIEANIDDEYIACVEKNDLMSVITGKDSRTLKKKLAVFYEAVQFELTQTSIKVELPQGNTARITLVNDYELQKFLDRYNAVALLEAPNDEINADIMESDNIPLILHHRDLVQNSTYLLVPEDTKAPTKRSMVAQIDNLQNKLDNRDSALVYETVEAVLHHYKANYHDIRIVGEELEVKDKKTKIVYGEFDGLLIGTNITIICEVKSNVIDDHIIQLKKKVLLLREYCRQNPGFDYDVRPLRFVLVGSLFPRLIRSKCIKAGIDVVVKNGAGWSLHKSPQKPTVSHNDKIE